MSSSTFNHYNSVLNDPLLLTRITDHVSSGGSLIDLAAVLNVPYSRLLKFIRVDPERSKSYDTALADRQEWARERYLNELRSIGLLDMREIYTAEGGLKPIEEWPVDARRSIQAIEVEETFEGFGKDRVWTGYNKRVKFSDKLKALDMLGKNLKLWTDTTVINANLSLEDLLALSRNEVALKSDAVPAVDLVPMIESPAVQASNDSVTPDPVSENISKTLPPNSNSEEATPGFHDRGGVKSTSPLCPPYPTPSINDALNSDISLDSGKNIQIKNPSGSIGDAERDVL